MRSTVGHSVTSNWQLMTQNEMSYSSIRTEQSFSDVRSLSNALSFDERVKRISVMYCSSYIKPVARFLSTAPEIWGGGGERLARENLLLPPRLRRGKIAYSRGVTAHAYNRPQFKQATRFDQRGKQRHPLS
jgi:hypothetical protein